jgi:probable F420-dependent oxidoreductase
VAGRDLGTVGVWSRELRLHDDDAELRAAAKELEELGYSALFIPGGTGGDDLLPAVQRLLEATRSVAVVTGILNIWMHDAADVAAQTAAIETAHPDRFVVGLGISHAPLVDRDEPGRYRRPLASMSAYLDALDAADPPLPAAQRLIGALGPKMLDLAGDRTLGAHPYFVPVAHTRFARERLGPGPLLAVEQMVLLETDPDVARAIARANMKLYLTLPNYVGALLGHGFTQDDLRDGGSDRLVDAIIAWGDETAIAERVAEHRAAGADHVCVQVLRAAPQGLPIDEWRRLAGALT